VTADDGLVHRLRRQCCRCGSERPFTYHEVDTLDGRAVFYRCAECGAPNERDSVLGSIALPRVDPN
jgi:uncharacterized Zn finger protein